MIVANAESKTVAMREARKHRKHGKIKIVHSRGRYIVILSKRKMDKRKR